jgi:hypothetical protein
MVISVCDYRSLRNPGALGNPMLWRVRYFNTETKSRATESHRSRSGSAVGGYTT